MVANEEFAGAFHLNPYNFQHLEINFTATVAMPINIIVYAEFDNIIEITGNRNIQMDYT